MKKILLSLFVACLLVTGCGVAKLENGQDAVVTLKNYEVSADTLYDDLKSKYAISSLIDMIDTKILAKEYDSKEEKEEIDEQVNAQIESYIQSYGSEAKLLEAASSSLGLSTRKELEEYFAINFRRTKAVEDYAKSIVTDDEINDFYEDTIFGDIEAKHILIAPEVKDGMTDDDKEAAEAAALKKAKEIIKKLDKGEDFAKLAKENSDDEGSAEKGGDLGTFAHGKMVTEFEKAAVALKVGKYSSEPVKTTHGYHIILKVSQKDKPALKKIKDDIIEELAQNKTTADNTLQVTALVKLREKYDIKWEDTSLKKKYDAYVETLMNNAKEANNSANAS